MKEFQYQGPYKLNSAKTVVHAVKQIVHILVSIILWYTIYHSDFYSTIFKLFSNEFKLFLSLIIIPTYLKIVGFQFMRLGYRRSKEKLINPWSRRFYRKGRPSRHTKPITATWRGGRAVLVYKEQE